MKKLIFLLLIIALGCSDLEMKPTERIKEEKLNPVSPQSCVEFNEPKGFFIYEISGNLNFGYDAGTYATYFSYPVNSVHMIPYQASIVYKNQSNYPVYLYHDGVLKGTIAANGQKLVTWTSSPTCHECTGTCPYSFSTTFHWWIVPKTGNPCTVRIVTSIIVNSPNYPAYELGGSIYDWINPDC